MVFSQKKLNVFNFGPNIKQWVKALCNVASSCISVNGQYSQWFGIQRGVRQGHPLSPYLYLICAEILSLIIRNNNIIKDIRLKEKDVLLSQFADDTSLCLDCSEESFREAINTLKQFSHMSGLRVNEEKT